MSPTKQISDRASVVFLAHYAEPLRSVILPLCEHFKEGELRPLVLAESDPGGKMTNMCRDREIDCDSRVTQLSASSSKAEKSPKKLTAFRWLRRVVRQTLKSQRKIRSCVKKLTDCHCRVLVLLDDRTITACHWIKAAERIGIPTYVVQWAAFHTPATLVSLRAKQVTPKTSTTQQLESWVAKSIPQGVSKRDGRTVWFMGSDQTVALWLAGAYPKYNPWTFGGGNANAVAAMGQEWSRRMINAGARAECVEPTGYPDQDRWYKAANSQEQHVHRDFDIPAEKQIVTMILPAICFRENRGARAGDIKIEDLQDDLVAAGRMVQQLGSDVQLIAKVHPRDDEERVQFLREHIPEAIITRDYDVHQLLAASRIALCQWSTTALIAQAMGTPIVVFDFHSSPSFELWKDTKGLLQATSPQELEHLLQDLMQHGEAYRSWHEQRREFVREYLCLDGRATERLVGRIQELAQQRRAA